MLKLIGINITADTAWWWLLLALAVGFVVIIYGGNWFVDSSVWIAEKLKVPALIIGATIVSIGTTLPEMLVSFMAAATGDTGAALGNAVGSPLCNTALILAIILAFSSATLERKQFAPKMAFLLFSAIFIALAAIDKKLGYVEGALLLVIFVAFVAFSIWEAKKNPVLEPPEETEKVKAKPAWLMIALFFVGALFIALGANLLVDSVSAAAEQVGISPQIIGLTIVALGTSLPELVTAITSLKKNNPAISIGNIIGANIINLTLIVGGSALLGGEITLAAADATDFFIAAGLLLASLLIVALPILIKKRTYRWQGFSMLAIYAAYIVFLVVTKL